MHMNSRDDTMLHAVCGAFSIDAVTLRPYSRRGSRHQADWQDVARFYKCSRVPTCTFKFGRIIEGSTRSLNNILERLHQSFFFYYLPAPYRYISIGDYMPGVGCLIGAILVRAIAAWMHWSRLTVRAV